MFLKEGQISSEPNIEYLRKTTDKKDTNTFCLLQDRDRTKNKIVFLNHYSSVIRRRLEYMVEKSQLNARVKQTHTTRPAKNHHTTHPLADVCLVVSSHWERIYFCRREALIEEALRRRPCPSRP